MKAYTAIHTIHRGRKSEPSVVNAGQLFHFEGDELERLLENGSVRESTDDEIALAKGRSKKGAVDVSSARLDTAEAATAEANEKLAAAEKEKDDLAAELAEVKKKLAAAEKANAKAAPKGKAAKEPEAAASGNDTSSENKDENGSGDAGDGDASTGDNKSGDDGLGL